ncbi:MAG TPA: Gfo/Idh/MocA family oxidoreductase [Jatrophihabitantaceae bacterium]|nr:Gfo/Idh/MocA family oxidoreductase [Jatrophihabitantaceae bacterium]
MTDLRIGMVGHAFMGRAHSQAWRVVNRFFDLPLAAEMTAVCGHDEQRTAAAAQKLGWQSYETDWHALIERDDIDVIDICTPGDSHAEIAIAALRAGKHVLCEKPLANTVDEARAKTDAADASDVRSMCGYSYRRVPAVALMARMVADGRVGQIRHVRAVYLQDWLVDQAAPLTWRMQAERAGLGAMGDIASHIVDMVQYLTGQRITGVSGLTETFIHERPLLDGTGSGPVTVDDAGLFVARLSGGAVATFEATRLATGRKNALRVEINGSAGSLAFDLERLNELEYYDLSLPSAERGFARILATEPDHPYVGAWWPPGHLLGYEHAFTNQARDFIDAIATGTDPSPSFVEALNVQLVLDAVVRSGGSWTEFEPT